MSKRIQLADCCNGDCRQWRDCPRPPVFPMNTGEGMEQDEPLYSYDSVTAPIPWCIWIGASVCALLCFYILCGGADDLYLYVLREW